MSYDPIHKRSENSNAQLTSSGNWLGGGPDKGIMPGLVKRREIDRELFETT